MSDEFAEIDAFVRSAQWNAVEQALAGLLQQPTNDIQGWRTNLRRVQMRLRQNEATVDEGIMELEDLMKAPPFVTGEIPRRDVELAFGLLMQAAVDKRCPELAAEIDLAANEALGDSAELELRRGHKCMAFDERDAARRHFERACTLADDPIPARYGLGDFHYVVGEFERCLAELDEIPGDHYMWPAAARLRAAVAAAQENVRAERACWESLVRARDRPEASDRISYGLALAHDGDRQGALEQFHLAWKGEPDSSTGRYARQRIEFLEGKAGGSKRKQLKAFPTTAQKRDYCGPAVLELCLRYLDFDLEQDEIAKEVFRGTGTPMFEIVQYLAQHGIVARRIEGTSDNLRSAIDLGLPVIVQEEYSTTSHVAVVTGYDDSLGLLVTNDPATHRQILKPFTWMTRAGDLFGNGALLVLGRRGEVVEEIEARCDAVGLIEQRHLVLVDECDRLRATASVQTDTTPHEVVRLCDQALALSPAFKLAWHRRTWALTQIAANGRSDSAWHEMFAALKSVRTRFPWDEWTHQLHARILMLENRYEEAFVEYFEASQRDPDDADNLERMGFCKWHTGDLAAAQQYCLRALSLDPTHRGATFTLAGIYLRQLEADLPRGDEDPFAWARLDVPSSIVVSLESPREVVLRRAWHYSRIALSYEPDAPQLQTMRALVDIHRDVDLEDAKSLLQAAVASQRTAWSVVGLAGCLERLDQPDTAAELLQSATDDLWGHVEIWMSLANLRARRGETGATAEVLEQALDAAPEDRSVVARRLFRVVQAESGTEAAAAKLREVATKYKGDGNFVRDIAWFIDEQRQRGHAIALFRHVVEHAPSDVASVYQLGCLLVDSITTREEGRELLRRTIELAPSHPAPRRRLALSFLAEAPSIGLDLLDPVLGSEDPYTWEARAALLEATGRSDEADDVLAQALSYGEHPQTMRLALVDWHLDHYRYDRALSLVRDVDLDTLPADARTWGEGRWLAAFRLTGSLSEIEHRLTEMCEGGVPDHLAYNLYQGYRGHRLELAGQAALVQSAKFDDEWKTVWEIRAAAQEARAGDASRLERLETQIDEFGVQELVALAWAYALVERKEEQRAMLNKAEQIDPNDLELLSALDQLYDEDGDFEKMMACSRRVLELHPYEHLGPERLGWSLAREGDLEPALEYSLQAVDAAPYCHLAHSSRAIALFMAEEFDQARQHVDQALRLSPPSPLDPDDVDLPLVDLALRGEAEELDARLAKRAEKEAASYAAPFKAKLVEVARIRSTAT